MASQKIENVMNLALAATPEERAKSDVLEVGYDREEQVWELIIRYFGDLTSLRDLAETVVELYGGYAIVTVAESNIDALADMPQVEFIEKPKRLFFQIANGKRVSCITSVQTRNFGLFGEGVLIGIIDTGIDYANIVFRNPDGTSRIKNLWDQTVPGNPPAGYAAGSEYTQEQINQALQAPTREERMAIVPSTDPTGHGTAVAGIAAGGEAENGVSGVATASELIVVKLGIPREEGFPRTTELMQAVDYVIKKAMEYQRPIAVNISSGNTYGSHHGDSLLERFIDDMSNVWKSVICIGTGNEAAGAGHTSGRILDDQEQVIQLAIQEREPAINAQIWKAYEDIMEISIISPSGVRIGPLQEILGPQRFDIGNTQLLLYYGEPSPYSVRQEIFIDFLPKNTYIDSGVWRILLTPRQIVDGEFELWLPSANVLNVGTGFLYPQNSMTMTIPSTAARSIAVGAYNGLTFSLADFSGQGYPGEDPRVKPDLVAPGVNINAPVPGGGPSQNFTGTSFAVPFVTGGAALLMEWGMVKGNDPYLYGEKVRAYLRRGARPLPGFSEYPNAQVGYGVLCVRDSIPQ